MWFLRVETLLGILLIGLVMMAAVRLLRKGDPNVPLALLSLLCVVFLGVIDLRLLGFYLAYSAVIFGLTRLLVFAPRAEQAPGAGAERAPTPGVEQAPGAERAPTPGAEHAADTEQTAGAPRARPAVTPGGILFCFGVLICLAPVLILRLWEGAAAITIIGVAFALLRGIDAVYYAHFTGEDVKPLPFLAYMVFIPTFTAGPVFRYRDFEKASAQLKSVTIVDFVEAIKRIIRGLFKTVVVSQLLSQVFSHITAAGAEYNVLTSVLAVACSYLMLYFDFSGYSDIAIAMGRLCGFVVPENFRKPWQAASFTLLWRSWHITVSDWIREHVYVLLHDRKLSKAASAAVPLAVMILMGFWHGFTRGYIIMGVYLGLLLAAENLLGLTSPKKKWTPVRVARCAIVNFLFAINTLVFFTDLRSIWAIVTGLFRFW